MNYNQIPLTFWVLGALLSKRERDYTITSMMTAYRVCHTEAEARGSFLMAIERNKPGFSIDDMTCMSVSRDDLHLALDIGDTGSTEEKTIFQTP
jgi:hypothetical protein